MFFVQKREGGTEVEMHISENKKWKGEQENLIFRKKKDASREGPQTWTWNQVSTVHWGRIQTESSSLHQWWVVLQVNQSCCVGWEVAEVQASSISDTTPAKCWTASYNRSHMWALGSSHATVQQLNTQLNVSMCHCLGLTKPAATASSAWCGNKVFNEKGVGDKSNNRVTKSQELIE